MDLNFELNSFLNKMYVVSTFVSPYTTTYNGCDLCPQRRRVCTPTPTSALSSSRTGDRTYQYGYQRLWGAFGWGVCAFVVGAVVSSIQIEECKEGRHVDYILSFYVYAIMMALAFICAAFFSFKPVESNADYTESLWEAIKMITDSQHICFGLTLLTSGSAMGFVHTFLFWHLHDLGGTQFLFSVISAVQCLSEVITYMLSSYLILKIGCENVLYIGLLSNVLRLLAYSIITQPVLSIGLEILQGISSASIWTASICYIGLIPGTPVTLQALLHGIYWGLGHGGGGILGGVMVTYIGSNASFIIYAVICLVNFMILVGMKYRSKLLELLCNYTYVENIPAGTYILTTMSQRQPSDVESQME